MSNAPPVQASRTTLPEIASPPVEPSPPKAAAPRCPLPKLTSPLALMTASPPRAGPPSPAHRGSCAAAAPPPPFPAISARVDEHIAVARRARGRQDLVGIVEAGLA